MFFAFVAVSVSLGSITPQTHPSTRLLADAEMQTSNTADRLAVLNGRLATELSRANPFIAPGIVFGAAALHAVVGVVFTVLLPKLLFVALTLMIGFFSVGAVLLLTGVGMSISAAVQQGRRANSVKRSRN